MPKYGKKAGEKVEKAMRERKEGTLKSGRSGRKVTSKKQAIAIGLAEAREAGGKVPAKEIKEGIKEARLEEGLNQEAIYEEAFVEEVRDDAVKAIVWH